MDRHGKLVKESDVNQMLHGILRYALDKKGSQGRAKRQRLENCPRFQSVAAQVTNADDQDNDDAVDDEGDDAEDGEGFRRIVDEEDEDDEQEDPDDLDDPLGNHKPDDDDE